MLKHPPVMAHFGNRTSARPDKSCPRLALCDHELEPDVFRCIQPKTYSVVWHYVLLSVARPLEDLVKARSGQVIAARLISVLSNIVLSFLVASSPSFTRTSTMPTHFGEWQTAAQIKPPAGFLRNQNGSTQTPDASFRKMRKSLHGNFESSGKGKASQTLRETSR